MESGKQETYTPDEIIAHLIEAEWDDRQNRSIEQKIKMPGLDIKAAVEDILYRADRNIDKNQIMRFIQCSFIDKHENIIITGSTGIGKSYLASALGHHACSMGYKVVYYNVPKLFAKLKWLKPTVLTSKKLLK